MPVDVAGVLEVEDECLIFTTQGKPDGCRGIGAAALSGAAAGADTKNITPNL